MSEGIVSRVAHRIEEVEALETIARAAEGVIRRPLDQPGVKAVLGGEWLGHAAHPMLTDLPIGFWTGSMVLDLVGGKRGRPAADLFVLLGNLTALPTIATGLTDFTYLDDRAKRVGVVHATANAVGLGFYVASYASRRHGHRLKGVALGFVGATALTVGGALGGHLAFAQSSES
ncbi:MAG TPA: DUF2231 domain-containing protein [Acidimicrobiales bacterium]|nr:DUF2231 domain-containing protein [Acidimicrobiales bacterium]